MNAVAFLPSAGVAESIRMQMLECGSASALIASLPVTLSQWRRIARAVARELGRPVTTTALGGVMVHAVLMDWPATDEERERGEKLMREAVDFAAFPLPDERGLRVL